MQEADKSRSVWKGKIQRHNPDKDAEIRGEGAAVGGKEDGWAGGTEREIGWQMWAVARWKALLQERKSSRSWAGGQSAKKWAACHVMEREKRPGCEVKWEERRKRRHAVIFLQVTNQQAFHHIYSSTVWPDAVCILRFSTFADYLQQKKKGITQSCFCFEFQWNPFSCNPTVGGYGVIFVWSHVRPCWGQRRSADLGGSVLKRHAYPPCVCRERTASLLYRRQAMAE